MKVRVCPNCGKHNNENAFNCADCGATLSIKTLMDVDSGQLLNVKPIAGYTELADISPYFEQDVVEVIKKVVQINETIVWGCNITTLAQTGGVAPLLPSIMIVPGNALLFGYLIITNRRLTCVYFEADPKRSHLELWATHNSLKPIFAVERPGFELSPKEKSSRQVVTYLLGDLVSIRLESKGIRDISLVSLNIMLKQNKEKSITFYGLHEAEKAQKLLAAEQKS